MIIFDLFGNILQKFSCSKHLEFPNGVVVNDREEIFISDNRAHCVKVFNYQGMNAVPFFQRNYISKDKKVFFSGWQKLFRNYLFEA